MYRMTLAAGLTGLEDILTQAFGIALKLTIAGNNQLTHASTYLFGLTVLGCILVQMVGDYLSRLRSTARVANRWDCYE